MKPSVYLETTIISYLAARPSRDLVTAAHQQVTHEWWRSHRERYRLLVSDAVLEEAGRGDKSAAARRIAVVGNLPVLPVTRSCADLADYIMSSVDYPRKALVDALHLATAALNSATYLLTWNCSHIASAKYRPRIESACRAAGVVPPQIVTPLEMSEM